MNIILANKQKVSVIKGWPLEGNRVVSTAKIMLNDEPLKVYFTKKNFYVFLQAATEGAEAAWYNGGIVGSDHDPIMPLFAPEGDSAPYCVTTARSYLIVEPEISISENTGNAEQAAPKAEATVEVDAPEDTPVELTRVMKKDAIAAFRDGKDVTVKKFRKDKQKRVTILEETSEVLDANHGGGLDDFLADYFPLHRANKGNVYFFIEA